MDIEATQWVGARNEGVVGTARQQAPPWVDESLRPQYKASYALSLNEFKWWHEMANA